MPYNEQPLYTEDWIGLRTLDEAGKVHFQVRTNPVRKSPFGSLTFFSPLRFMKHTPGGHMQFTMQYLHDAVVVPWLNNTL